MMAVKANMTLPIPSMMKLWNEGFFLKLMQNHTVAAISSSPTKGSKPCHWDVASMQLTANGSWTRGIIRCLNLSNRVRPVKKSPNPDAMIIRAALCQPRNL